MLTHETKTDLIKKAEHARHNSYAPYSHFSVGAALLCKNGNLYTGVNIENSSFGATLCAERSAFASAISAGEREFLAVAVVGGIQNIEADKPCPPCGICRQFMSELCGEDFLILLSDGDGITEYTLAQMLPHSFGNENLNL